MAGAFVEQAVCVGAVRVRVAFVVVAGADQLEVVALLSAASAREVRREARAARAIGVTAALGGDAAVASDADDSAAQAHVAGAAVGVARARRLDANAAV